MLKRQKKQQQSHMAHKFVGFNTFRLDGGGWLIRAEERDVNLLTTTRLDYECQCVSVCVLGAVKNRLLLYL